MGHAKRGVRRERGFTLIEASVAVAIVGVLATLSYSGYDGMRERAASRNGVRDIAAVLKRGRAEAFSRGRPTVFFVHWDGTAARYEYGLVVDRDADFNPDDIAASLESSDTTLVREELPRGVFFARAGAPVLSKPLPAPLAAVPANAPCTFCNGTTEVVVVFTSDGRARLGPDPADHELGGSFTILSSDPRKPDEGRPIDQQTLAVLSRTGSVVAFDRGTP